LNFGVLELISSHCATRRLLLPRSYSRAVFPPEGGSRYSMTVYSAAVAGGSSHLNQFRRPQLGCQDNGILQRRIFGRRNDFTQTCKVTDVSILTETLTEMLQAVEYHQLQIDNKKSN